MCCATVTWDWRGTLGCYVYKMCIWRHAKCNCCCDTGQNLWLYRPTHLTSSNMQHCLHKLFTAYHKILYPWLLRPCLSGWRTGTETTVWFLNVSELTLKDMWNNVYTRVANCLYAHQRGYFGVYFPRGAATREINPKITREWAHKQFITRVHLYLISYTTKRVL